MSAAIFQAPACPEFTLPEPSSVHAVERALERRNAAVADLQGETVATIRAAEIIAERLARLRAREAAAAPAFPFSNSGA